MTVISTDNTVIKSWADEIRPHFEAAAENLIEAGEKLILAKERLPHGSFGPLLNEIGITQRSANRSMRIAETFANWTRVSELPTAVGVLDVLARLDDDQLDRHVDAGSITTDTTRAEAEALVADEQNLDHLADRTAHAVRLVDDAIGVDVGAIQHRDHVLGVSVVFVTCISLQLERNGDYDPGEAHDWLTRTLRDPWTAIPDVGLAALWIGDRLGALISVPFADQLAPDGDLADAARRWLDGEEAA